MLYQDIPAGPSGPLSPWFPLSPCKPGNPRSPATKTHGHTDSVNENIFLSFSSSFGLNLLVLVVPLHPGSLFDPEHLRTNTFTTQIQLKKSRKIKRKFYFISIPGFPETPGFPCKPNFMKEKGQLSFITVYLFHVYIVHIYMHYYGSTLSFFYIYLSCQWVLQLQVDLDTLAHPEILSNQVLML